VILFKRFWLVALLLLQVTNAYATPPDVSGVYENQADGEIITIKQSGSAIYGDSTEVYSSSDFGGFIGPYTSKSTLTGTVDDLGHISATDVEIVRDSNGVLHAREETTISGTFSNGTITSTSSGTRTEYDIHGNVTASYPVSYSDTDVRISHTPSVTETATVVGEALIQSSVKQTTTMISKRIASIIKPASFIRQNVSTDKSENKSFEVANAQGIDTMFSSTQFKESQSDAQISSGNVGLSAGDASQTRGIWANLSSTDIEDSNTLTESDASITTYIAGYDQMLDDKTLVGISVTYEDVSVDSAYNGGSLDSDGITIAPYISYNINDSMAVYAIAGYGWLSYDQNQFNNTAKSDLDAERAFVELNFMAFQNIDRVLFNERIGYLYTHESQDSYTERYTLTNTSAKIKSNSISFSQLKANFEVAYAGDDLEPYFDIGYYYDTDYEKVSGISTDRTGGDYTFGLRIHLSDQLLGEVTATQNFSRHKFNETNFSGNIRYSF